jgi:hypothetical protein
METIEINEEEFNKRSKGKWKGEHFELFKCKNCFLIIFGIPDCHYALFDPENLEMKISYNFPHKTKCPNCACVVYDPLNKQNELTLPVSLEDITGSKWNWLLKQK